VQGSEVERFNAQRAARYLGIKRHSLYDIDIPRERGPLGRLEWTKEALDSWKASRLRRGHNLAPTAWREFVQRPEYPPDLATPIAELRRKVLDEIAQANCMQPTLHRRAA
jgi:hypothetical protein